MSFIGGNKMIKAIAADMDGTFLTDEKEYDKQRFLKQYEKMKANGIAFIVASGNQYWHLKKYFPEIAEEITFIAENGACIIEKGKVVFERALPKVVITDILDVLERNEDLKDFRLVMSGKKHAYIYKESAPEYMKKAQFFYQELQAIKDYRTVEDTIYKFALNFPAETVGTCVQTIQENLFQRVKAVTSGHEAVDLIDPSVGKEAGLTFLMKRWQLEKDQIAVFGDNLNDLGMFELVNYSFAMGNSREELKDVAYKIIGTNNQHAVLDQIDVLLEEERRN